MLRLVHNQTVAGPVLVDDIDDGLPNKEVYRLGSTANPKAYVRDGYANKPKQACYVPYRHTTPTGSVVAGYINLNQTERVLYSAGKGKIAKMSTPVTAGGPGLITVVSLTAANIVAPIVTAAAGSGGTFTITGTTLSSVSPDTTTVTFGTGTGAFTPSPAVWTQAAILAASGTISGTSITIPLSAFSVEPVTNNTVTVNANEQNSSVFTVGSVTDLTPVITGATTVGSNFVITGTYFGNTTLVTYAIGTGGTAPGPATMSNTTITGAGGTITSTTITVPLTAFTTDPVAGNTVKVSAGSLNSNVFVST